MNYADSSDKMLMVVHRVMEKIILSTPKHKRKQKKYKRAMQQIVKIEAEIFKRDLHNKGKK